MATVSKAGVGSVKGQKAVIIGAGINGLVAANYLQRAGCQVTLLERDARPGGACINASVEINGQQQDYALGASVLGLMQDFVWHDTGLAQRLTGWAPQHPKLVHFPGQREPTWIYRDPAALDAEFSRRWGEHGDLRAFRADESRVVEFLQRGYRAGRPPSMAQARAELGEEPDQPVDLRQRARVTGALSDRRGHAHLHGHDGH